MACGGVSLAADQKVWHPAPKRMATLRGQIVWSCPTTIPMWPARTGGLRPSVAHLGALSNCKASLLDWGFRSRCARSGLMATTAWACLLRACPSVPTAVCLHRIERVEQGVIHVLGADLMDGTPIYDIKPYIPYADAHPEARGGFTDPAEWQPLQVGFDAACGSLPPTSRHLRI